MKKLGLDAGEQRIRRAFWVSVALFLAGGLTIYLMQVLTRPPADIQSVEEAEIQAPSRQLEVPADQPPTVPFTDITEAAGIDFVHVNGAYGERLMPETIGSGAAFFDFDQDGRPDLLLVNSEEWPGRAAGGAAPARAALYRNLGGGRFEDVARQVGLDLGFYGMGVAIADYDGDGWPDVYLTGLQRNYLFR